MFAILCFIFLIVGLFNQDYTLLIASSLYGIAGGLYSIATRLRKENEQ